MEETPKAIKEAIQDFLDTLSEYLESGEAPPGVQGQLDDIYVNLETIVEFL